jgi:hypothetical protein
MAVMHLYFNFTQPLFIQALMGIKGLYDAKPVSIHLLGNLAVGELKRPFKVAGLFGRKSPFLRVSSAAGVAVAVVLVPPPNFPGHVYVGHHITFEIFLWGACIRSFPIVSMTLYHGGR